MALSAKENEQLTDMLERIRPNVDQLTDWQKSFIRDQMDRHAKYGDTMFLSAKQWAKIKEIYNDCVGDEDPDEQDDIENDPDYERDQDDERVEVDLDDDIPF